MPQKKETLIERTCYKGSQEVHYIEMWETEGRKFRIKISVGSNTQSYIKVWDTISSDWKYVYDIPRELMDCKKSDNISFYSSRSAEQQQTHFMKDVKLLKERAYQIVF